VCVGAIRSALGCSLGLRLIVCEPVEGDGGASVLTADRTVRCGESPKLVLLQIGGAAVFFGIAPLPLCLPIILSLVRALALCSAIRGAPPV
jgi:hypothetical protein